MLNAMTRTAQPDHVEPILVPSVMMALRRAFDTTLRAILGTDKLASCDRAVNGLLSTKSLWMFTTVQPTSHSPSRFSVEFVLPYLFGIKKTPVPLQFSSLLPVREPIFSATLNVAHFPSFFRCSNFLGIPAFPFSSVFRGLWHGPILLQST